MFAKNDIFNKYLTDAKKLANDLNDLERKCIQVSELIAQEVATESKTASERNKKKYIEEVLQKSPFSHPKNEQEVLRQELTDKAMDMTYDFMTQTRDANFKEFCKLYKALRTLSSLAQANLIKAMELKENAHNRDVWFRSGHLTKKIAQITDLNIINLFIQFQERFQSLNHISELMSSGILFALMFVPSDKTPPEAVKNQYKLRAAWYKDNECYQLLKDLVEASKDTKAMESFNQFLTKNPDSRHLSQELIETLKPKLKEIEALYSNTLSNINNVIEIIEHSRELDVTAFTAIKFQ